MRDASGSSLDISFLTTPLYSRHTRETHSHTCSNLICWMPQSPLREMEMKIQWTVESVQCTLYSEEEERRVNVRKWGEVDWRSAKSLMVNEHLTWLSQCDRLNLISSYSLVVYYSPHSGHSWWSIDLTFKCYSPSLSLSLLHHGCHLKLLFSLFNRYFYSHFT